MSCHDQRGNQRKSGINAWLRMFANQAAAAVAIAGPSGNLSGCDNGSSFTNAYLMEEVEPSFCREVGAFVSIRRRRAHLAPPLWQLTFRRRGDVILTDRERRDRERRERMKPLERADGRIYGQGGATELLGVTPGRTGAGRRSRAPLTAF